jgi:hypothetical protein
MMTRDGSGMKCDVWVEAVRSLKGLLLMEA